MQSIIKFKSSILFSSLFLMFFSSVSYSALHDRSGGLIYDDVLDVTWLQDANYAKSSGYDSDGLMSWNSAKVWADSLVIHDGIRHVDYTDWRLPKTLSDGIPFHYGWWWLSESYPSIVQTELSYMYYENLGLKGYDSCGGCWQGNFGIFGVSNTIGQNNVGPVNNLQSGFYYTDLIYTPQEYNRTLPWVFSTNTGNHHTAQFGDSYVWVLRDGDVAAIPEAETYSMLLAGLSLIVFMVRRRKVI